MWFHLPGYHYLSCLLGPFPKTLSLVRNVNVKSLKVKSQRIMKKLVNRVISSRNGKMSFPGSRTHQGKAWRALSAQSKATSVAIYLGISLKAAQIIENPHFEFTVLQSITKLLKRRKTTLTILKRQKPPYHCAHCTKMRDQIFSWNS